MFMVDKVPGMVPFRLSGTIAHCDSFVSCAEQKLSPRRTRYSAMQILLQIRFLHRGEDCIGHKPARTVPSPDLFVRRFL